MSFIKIIAIVSAMLFLLSGCALLPESTRNGYNEKVEEVLKYAREEGYFLEAFAVFERVIMLPAELGDDAPYQFLITSPFDSPRKKCEDYVKAILTDPRGSTYVIAFSRNVAKNHSDDGWLNYQQFYNQNVKNISFTETNYYDYGEGEDVYIIGATYKVESENGVYHIAAQYCEYDKNDSGNEGLQKFHIIKEEDWEDIGGYEVFGHDIRNMEHDVNTGIKIYPDYKLP